MKTATGLAVFLALFAATPAYAHLGHVGEVAGHSHWIGLAAASAAAAIAIAVSTLGKKKDAEEDDPETEAEDTVGDESPAKG
jgi:hypothetical protein